MLEKEVFYTYNIKNFIFYDFVLHTFVVEAIFSSYSKKTLFWHLTAQS